MYNQSLLMLISLLWIMSGSFYSPVKGAELVFSQIRDPVLKVVYLLAGVASADLAVGHGAVFGGSEVVEGPLVAVAVTRLFRQRQSGEAWTEVVVLLWPLVRLKLPVI